MQICPRTHKNNAWIEILRGLGLVQAAVCPTKISFLEKEREREEIKHNDQVRLRTPPWVAHANHLDQNVLCLYLALTIQPVLREMLKMKVVLLILILTNLSSTHFKMPGMVRNWGNSLVGLDSFPFGHYHHLDTEMKKVYMITC